MRAQSVLLLTMLVLASTDGSGGASAAEDANGADARTDFFLPDELRRLMDWNGQRRALEKKGLRFTFTYYGDTFANPIGGVKQGAGYDGRFGAIVDADLDKLAGWSGAAFHASVQQIHGTQFSASNLSNLMTASGIEAPPSTRLFNLWIEQSFGTNASMRMGQFTAAQEFLVSQNANLFVNSSFGWPAMNAVDLPSGGPAYPEATPGVRLQYQVTDQLTMRAAVFNGDPAGPGTNNPVERDPYGLAFRVNDPPFLIAEAAYSYGQIAEGRENPHQEGYGRAGPPRLIEGNLPGTIKLGAWYDGGSFADVAPVFTPHAGDYALYAVIDQMLWRLPAGSGDRGLSVFARGSVVPSDRNPIDRYIDGGLTFKGPLANRPDDMLGLAVAYGRISPKAADAVGQTIGSGAAMPIPDLETTVELTYQWKLAENWFVQPDLQFIIHPGAHMASPANPTSTIPNALVIGTRTTLRF